MCPTTTKVGLQSLAGQDKRYQNDHFVPGLYWCKSWCINFYHILNENASIKSYKTQCWGNFKFFRPQNVCSTNLTSLTQGGASSLSLLTRQMPAFQPVTKFLLCHQHTGWPHTNTNLILWCLNFTVMAWKVGKEFNGWGGRLYCPFKGRTSDLGQMPYSMFSRKVRKRQLGHSHFWVFSEITPGMRVWHRSTRTLPCFGSPNFYAQRALYILGIFGTK